MPNDKRKAFVSLRDRTLTISLDSLLEFQTLYKASVARVRELKAGGNNDLYLNLRTRLRDFEKVIDILELPISRETVGL